MNRVKPYLQVALDATDLITALGSVRDIADDVDVIEIGTVLAFADGMGAVGALRRRYPNHILVCDMKLLDAGETLAHMAFSAGADWITVGAAAHIETVRSAQRVAEQFGGEVQIELFGHWTIEDAKLWVESGVTQAIYHRSRDAQAAGVGWSEQDLMLMKQLSDTGLELSITGGIVPEDIHLFKDIRAKSFIAGRALANHNGKAIAREFREQINHYW
ncbi:3-keto-L-gulonate-6-phosphate decarboxylase UlaD [Vibrio mangrovi]|uniref:3-keto-L-gulonate-6-phosphate decarboxylase SgbH n=1 Tax=Vibrio mangrovi TaxID=474394 RepID=A0A1Y6IW55_9VIBR|nr:3-keto-L-gulonate-6-phosphate decarboxylase UlaD [Vibrio mangrovi]MDW6003019.1 3-keto-L-gulonate-6-phosphate decarboxylase UlaD [Vibrio mangrovi]SMS01261.1 3-keto-L-gulonate-6-phosphate decarboxylase SgbH [Vibrio mangrovi]